MGESAPGWYPSPSGGPNRYWDGVAWHDAVPVRPGSAPTKTASGAWKPLLIICGAAIVLGGVVMALGGGETKRSAGSSGSPFSGQEIRAGVIDTCQDDIRASLRDPDSARFSEWKAWPESAGDGKRYSAEGLVNAKNGFGGYAGAEMYTCSAEVSAGGTVRAEATPFRPAPTFRQPG